MSTDDIFYLVYYIIFGIVSTYLAISFARMGGERGPAIFTASIALFCWFVVTVIMIYNFG